MRLDDGKRIRILLLGFIFMISYSGYSQSLYSWSGLEKGQYDVGFKIINENDPNRKIRGNDRPMNLGVWYPAELKFSDNALKYQDYIAFRVYEDSLGGGSVKNEQLENTYIDYFKNSAKKKGGDIKIISNDLEHETLSYLNAVPTVGDFPIIIYSPGLGGSIYENAVLFEYLASNGYVVFSMPSNGKGTDMTFDLDGLTSAVDDIVWTRNFVENNKSAYTKSDKTGLIGYSWGGLASAIVTTDKKSAKFDTFISLDGTISYEDEMARDHFEDYNGANLSIPFLYMLAWGDHQNFSFFKEGGFERYLLKFQKMGHRNFNSDAIITSDRPSPPDLVEFYKRKGAEIEKSYGIMCQFSKAFLDKTLKGDYKLFKALKKQSKQTNNFSEAIHFFEKTNTYQKKSFTKLLEKSDFIGFIDSYYDYIINSKEEFSLFNEEELLNIVLKNFDIKDAKSARETGILLWINSRENPKSAKAFFELGNYYADFTPDNYNIAIRYYNMALDIDPGHKEAQKMITKLQEAEEQ